jgi:hypothetical protein
MDPRLRGDDDALRDAECVWVRGITPSPSGEGRGGAVPQSALSVARSRPPKNGHPNPEQSVFPREGGGPDWTPAFAGEQGSGGRPAQERASLSDRTTTSHASKNRGAQTPRPPHAKMLINCPTRHEKRTVAGCQRTPLQPRHRPHTPTPPPRRKCFPASILPILPHCSINGRCAETIALATTCRPNQPLPRAQRKRARGPSPPRPSSTPAGSDYSAAAVPLAGRMSRRSAIRAALPVRPRR